MLVHLAYHLKVYLQKAPASSRKRIVRLLVSMWVMMLVTAFLLFGSVQPVLNGSFLHYVSADTDGVIYLTGIVQDISMFSLFYSFAGFFCGLPFILEVMIFLIFKSSGKQRQREVT
jgi:hypothetical protein